MHFVECAVLMATGKPCLLPILEEGMLVRDFALTVREAYSVPEASAVILCDGETARPLRGMHWLLPNSAIQVKIIEAPAATIGGPATKPKHGKSCLTLRDDDRECVTVYLDGIVTPDGNGIGGIFLPTKTPSGDNPAVLTFHFPNVHTDLENDLLLAEEAVCYVQKRCGLNSMPKIYCASMHVIRSALGACKEKYSAHWLDMDSDILTDIRKKAVQKTTELV